MSEPLSGDPRLRIDFAGRVWLRGRLRGHHLLGRGEAYLASDCYIRRCSTNVGHTVHQENGHARWLGGAGHGICSCGVLSPHLRSYYARRRWHRRHKARVALAQPEPAQQPKPVNPREIA